MSKDDRRIDDVILAKRVKLHLFEPSQRKIWTVVGMGKEHWLDPELNFCSCPAYFFNTKEGERHCYHLASVKKAKEQNLVELVKFSDEEFPDFIAGLIADL